MPACKTLFLELQDSKVTRVTVDMGEPILDGPRIPVAAAGQMINQPLTVEGQILSSHVCIDGQSALCHLCRCGRPA